VNFATYSVLGMFQEADLLLKERGTAIRSAAKDLRRKHPFAPTMLHRGVLLEEHEVRRLDGAQTGLPYSKECVLPRPTDRSSSWTESLPVARWFASTRTAVSGYVLELRPGVTGWLARRWPSPEEVLLHWSWLPAIELGGITRPLWTWARANPLVDPAQVEWNALTQKEVVLEPCVLEVERVEVGPTESADLDSELCWPPFLTERKVTS
jgi:hypothetical protein